MTMKTPDTITIGKRTVGPGYPAYIIAEVGSNFDGSLKRAKQLAKLAKESGADAYKIQNFSAPKIVSDAGFNSFDKISYQAKWKESVFDMFQKSEFPHEWVKELADYCKEIGIDFFSSPYDREAVDMLEKVKVPAHKLGSGEIDNLDFLTYVAKTKKPMIIAVGASTMSEIEAAIKTVRKAGNKKIIILQCVTNYPSPVADANLRAMQTIQQKYHVLVGYSDHTIGKDGGGDDPLGGLTVPIGSIAMGGCMIEKHFTDDHTLPGPDHHLAMEPDAFKKMVDSVRAMERALGDGNKKLMPSEKQTVIVQRRGIYTMRDITKGEKVTKDMVDFLRPAVALRPPQIKVVLGKRATKNIPAGTALRANDVK